MKRSIFFFAASLFALAACSSSTDPSSSGEDTDATSDELSSTCKKEKCGPMPLGATYLCADGTTGGVTGRCLKTKGKCGWEIRECPVPPPPPVPPAPPPVDCTAPGACGPALGMPNYLCPDGKTVAGPTGQCLDKGGVCGWEVIACPK